MAKKKETKNKDKAADPFSSEDPASGAAKTPESSGEVKGPMGVGGRKKPGSGAVIKKPAKNMKSGARDLSGGKQEETDKKSSGASDINIESSGKALPERTSKTEEHLIVAPGSNPPAPTPRSRKKTVQGMQPKDTSPIILESTTTTERQEALKAKQELGDSANVADGQNSGSSSKATKKSAKPRQKASPPPLTDKVDAEEVKKKIREEKKKTSESKSEKSAAKKMARRKPEKGISAEEKAKLPDTSLSEDLSEAAGKTAKKIKDSLIPDEDTRNEFMDLAKTVLPDQDEIQKKAKNILKDLVPDEENLNRLANKLSPDGDLVKKAKKAGEEFFQKGKGLKGDSSGKKKTVETSLISDYDIHLFKEGRHYHLYKKLGSHLMEHLGASGVYFALWAPNAEEVTIIGDFNNWNRKVNQMTPREDGSGIWEAFVPEARNGSLYKYYIRSGNGYEVEKGDPYAFCWETPPNTASVVWDLKNTWQDDPWLEKRRSEVGKEKSITVYELHIGSWKRVPEENGRSLTYREMAEDLPGYLKEMGFSHVEFMPVMEHPFFGSWGYQVTGYFAPSSRFGTPQDFMHLVDSLHQEGIGVILDWVPSHFPSDMHGLHYFDGTFLYEHQDKNKGFHPDWQSYIFNYGRNEVKSFLISNALFWLDRFHVDGLRVDAVASMLYLDYSRQDGEWELNEHGGRENLEAIAFLKEFNEVVYREYPDTVTIAEESTAWPMVSRPTYLGGLGFGYKWMMGWMNDTLKYYQKNPIHRRHHQHDITFSINYAFTENFVLPLSHDEVVYGKQALLNKMPGDQWQQFANLRNLYAYMYAHPGSKLLFMGAEFGQSSEWNHDSSLDWHLLQYESHQKLKETIKELNQLFKTEPALHENLYTQEGFQWLDISDADNSVISFFRKSLSGERILIICNFTPIPRENYYLPMPEPGRWREIFNSDDERFGGSNMKNSGILEVGSGANGNSPGLRLDLPPLGVIYLKYDY